MKLSVEEQLKKATAILERGGVVAFPTETLYGLGAHPFKKKAVERIFKMKARPESMALPLLLAKLEDISIYSSKVPPLAWRLAEQFLPGALTLVLLKAPQVPNYVTGGSDAIALRVPNHPVPRLLAKKLGVPITGTSANISGTSAAPTAEEVRLQLGDKVDFIVDSGPPPQGHPHHAG